ncbi:MAG: succinylglutamate desuccinylase/aspartoacylase family protein [Deltaproteobacteria bacterium]|nr:MAG: succinylglutamate desuccinylase/aspartoacylase family protein [Deltaproteobacteria bacterium]
MQVQIFRDGLGQPVYLPLLVARGKRPGPVFGITAAVHGNELNGIPVIHRLFDQLDTKVLRGTVVAVVAVNVPGVLLHQRQFSEGADLNHVFPGRQDGAVGEVFAFRLLDRVVRHFDAMLDLHTASFGRVNSLYIRADMTNQLTAAMAYLMRPQIVVHNPPSDRTLRGAAAELGIPAVTVEIGDPSRFQPNYVKTTLTGVRAVLGELHMLPKRVVSLGPEPVLCSHSYWLYADRGGLMEVLPRVTDHVAAGEVIASLRDVFGEVTREYRAPEDGVVVGRSVNPVGQTGARILHLGLLADRQRMSELHWRASSPSVDHHGEVSG